VTQRNSAAQQVVAGLRGNPGKAETVLQWTREWEFQKTIQDMVRAELESRLEIDRANPQPHQGKKL